MALTKKINPESKEISMNRLPGFFSGKGIVARLFNILALTALAFSLFLVPISAAIAEEGETARSLDFADFKSTADGGVEIRLAFSGTPPTPTDFTSKSPAKLSIDLSKTKNNLPWSLPLPVDVAGVKSLKASQSNNRTRVAINMDSLTTYKIRSEGNNMFVTFPGKNSPATSAAPTSVAAATQTQAAPAPQAAPAQPAPRRTVPTPAPAPRRAVSGSGTALQDVTFTQLPGEKVQFKLSFSRNAVTPGSFTIDNPARIALDFPNTGSALGWKNKNVGVGFAKSITAVEAGNRTRVILNLVQLLPFETEVSGRNVYVTLAGGRAASKVSPSAPSKVSTAVPGDDTLHNISNIDFRRGAQGEGQIIITLSDANTPASTGESGNKIFVDFGNTGIPNDLLQRLDVIDFATPVQFIDTTRVGNRVRLSITPAGDYEYLAYHTGNTYTV